MAILQAAMVGSSMRFFACFLVFALAWSGASASAQMSLAEARTAIESSDAAQIQSGIEAIGLSGDAGGVPILVARVRRGLPPALLESALDTLAVLGRAEAGPLLIELLSHRRASIRLRAAQALTACHPAGADTALASALSDSSAEVRAAAATGLGDIGGVAAMDQLFLALDRGIAEAGIAIAHIARASDVPRVLALLGHVPLPQMSPIVQDLLARTNLPQRTRLDVVAAIGELASADARTMLEAYVQAHPGTDPVTRAAEAAAARIAQ
jgi:HEAT repeat protein